MFSTPLPFDPETYLVDAEELKTLKTLINEIGYIEAAKHYGHNVKDYRNSKLAGRLIVEYARSQAPKSFIEAMSLLQIKPHIFEWMKDYEEHLNEVLARTYDVDSVSYDLFSAQTMCLFYCRKMLIDGVMKIVETPQYLWMRVAIGLFRTDGIQRVIEAYEDYLYGRINPPTPQIYNASMIRSQYGSCFVLSIDDTTKSIAKQLCNLGRISADCGGIGLSLSDIRHSEIRGGGSSKGVVPICIAVDSHMNLFNQGSLRKGACTNTLNIWHIDIEDFIRTSKKDLGRYECAPFTNTAVWMPRLFRERLKSDGKWSLFCPAKTGDLNKLWGKAWEEKYLELESNATKVVKARDLMKLISETQIKTGMPYIMHRDSINEKSNQSHRGTIVVQNLCTEIVQYVEADLPAVCNLQSININAAVTENGFDFQIIEKSARAAVEALNRTFEETQYPLDEFDVYGKVVKKKMVNKSNNIDRPIGVGVCGYSDALQRLEIDYESPEARLFNRRIFAAIYWNCLVKSIELAIKDGKHGLFEGSNFSKGKLQPDCWIESFKDRKKTFEMEIVNPADWGRETPHKLPNGDEILPTWDSVREKIKIYGSRNCLLTAPMPTATSSNVRSVSECFEAPQTNFYSRKLMSGSAPIVNKYLQQKLKDIDLWFPDETINFLIEMRGSIRGYSIYLVVRGICAENDPRLDRVRKLEDVFKTMFEIKNTTVINLAAERGMYIDQSQSLNHYIKDGTRAEDLTKILLYAFDRDLKTVNYYIRQPSPEIITFTSNLKVKSDIKLVKQIMVGEMETKECKKRIRNLNDETEIQVEKEKIRAIKREIFEAEGVCRMIDGEMSCCDS